MTLVLIVLVIVLAAAGGFLGDLLEAAGWVIVVFVIFGAILGSLAYLWVRRALGRMRP